jgi:hypothetical protein
MAKGKTRTLRALLLHTASPFDTEIGRTLNDV